MTWLSLSSYTHKESRRKPTALLVEMERVTGFEPANESLGSFCLTTWPHPHISIEQYSAYGRSIVDNHHIRQRHRLRTEPRLIDRRPKIYRKPLFKHRKKQSCTVFPPAARHNEYTIEKGGPQNISFHSTKTREERQRKHECPLRTVVLFELSRFVSNCPHKCNRETPPAASMLAKEVATRDQGNKGRHTKPRRSARPFLGNPAER